MMDKDLEFLKKVDDKYLAVLIDVMINYDGGTSKIKVVKEECSKYGTSYQNYLDVVIDTYLNYGRDVLKVIGRADVRISYRHVLSECCEGTKVTFNQQASVETIENNLLNACLNLEDECNVEIDELIKIIVETYSKSKSMPWYVWITLPTFIAPPIFSPWWLSVVEIAKRIYKKCRPELQVILPSTLLIAVYRKMM